MFLWFLGCSVVIVWLIFQSPALDYRMVMAGSVLPLVEAIPGSPYLAHTLVGSVLLLTLVMLIGAGKPLRRRALIGLPIGTFLHLVLDASWTRSSLFWWPVTSGGFGTGTIPEIDRPIGVILLLEAIGGMALVWAWQRFGLDHRGPRSTFFRTGQMDRQVARHGPDAASSGGPEESGEADE